MYAPASMWPAIQEQLVSQVGELKYGDVSDFSNFMGAVIDANSFATQKEAIEEAKADAKSESSSAAATTTARATSSSRR